MRKLMPASILEGIRGTDEAEASATAMKLSGHRTPSVFRRYDIVSPDDLRDAARMLDAPLTTMNSS